ncbi:MAG: PLP-dependent aspartate aminotransferase family protein [Elusimicrobiota bacterium]|nr:PLP-dependent aspartate aminotransferase family protein [Elusimicrobiota bacterium]
MKKLSSKLIHTGDGVFAKKLSKAPSISETFPVYRTSVFAFEDIASVDAVYEKKAQGYVYSRIASPNADAVCEILAMADEGAAAHVFASGMAAITQTILSFVNAGDHIISSPILYGAVQDFFANELKRFGVEVSFVDFTKGDIPTYIKPNTKIIYTETMCNPLIEVANIGSIAKIARDHNLLFVIDNTFATPVVCKPLLLGADIVVYSATKYLGGHSDILAGACVCKNAAVAQRIKKTQILYGAVLSPDEAWLLARSLRTLDLRVKKHCANALEIAKFFAGNSKVEKVYYPGLKTSPFHKLAKAQFADGLFGAMMSVNFKGGAKKVESLIKRLKEIPFVPSLAGTATTLSYSIKTSHRFYDKAVLKKLGITDGQIRFSIGLEDPQDIIDIIKQALK